MKKQTLIITMVALAFVFSSCNPLWQMTCKVNNRTSSDIIATIYLSNGYILSPVLPGVTLPGYHGCTDSYYWQSIPQGKSDVLIYYQSDYPHYTSQKGMETLRYYSDSISFLRTSDSALVTFRKNVHEAEIKDFYDLENDWDYVFTGSDKVEYTFEVTDEMFK